jgi:hypothetical protein
LRGFGDVTTLHPQTHAAWARAIRPSGHVDFRPYDHKARAAWKYERTWDAIEAAYARREGTALWWEEGTAEAAKQQRAEAERARQEAALAEVRARLAVRGRGASAEQRASAWLACADAGSSKEAAYAVLVVVRGFGLGERDGRTMIEAEYVPRFYRKIQRVELDGWVRRAMTAQKPWGWKLTEERRAG